MAFGLFSKLIDAIVDRTVTVSTNIQKERQERRITESQPDQPETEAAQLPEPDQEQEIDAEQAAGIETAGAVEAPAAAEQENELQAAQPEEAPEIREQEPDHTTFRPVRQVFRPVISGADPADRKKCYYNRELSWLKFNERVLDEAGNPRVPLAERLSFASIYQSNLDEFFMVRVGTFMVQMNAKKQIRDNKTDMTAAQQVRAILKQTAKLEKKKAQIYDQLMGELEPKGIRIINFNKLSNDEGKLLENYFDVHIAPYLSPITVSEGQPFPFLNNKDLYAIVLLSSQKGKNRIGIVPCSNSVFRRLIEIPTRLGYFMLSEELILHFIGKIYPGNTIREKSVLRVTRSADIDLEEVHDEDMDYRNVMEKLLRKRTRLNPVRAELSRKINKEARKELAEFLGVELKHVINVNTPLDLSFVSELQDRLYEQTDLFYEKRQPQLSAALIPGKPVIPQIEEKDLFLAYPFESMKSYINLLHEAAHDPEVTSIKITLYRVANHSKVVEELIEAAENGKEVVCLCELRARFDEANNIVMSRRLEEAGCRILYGIAGYKVHSKLCLITRRSKDGTGYITQVGTGNYNEKTSTLYTDFSLMTADSRIGREAEVVFTALQQGEFVDNMEHLLVAPMCLQNRIAAMIDEQMDNARMGKPAYVGFKINSLSDKVLIDKIIEASSVGVQVELIVRGICCIVPGIKGYTENVRVISIVGRYLEHSRIYRFGSGADEKIYISSADLMTRNTERRVELAAPVYDEENKNRIRYIFDTIMEDDEKGRELLSDGEYIKRTLHSRPLNSQELFYDNAYNRVTGA